MVSPEEPIEALVAVTGVIKPTVTDAKIEKSFVLVEKLKKRLRAWILKPEIRPWEMPTQHDPAKLFESLGRPRDFSEEAAELGTHDAVEYSNKVAAVRASLVKRYPLSVSKDYLDDTIFPPSEDEAQDWLALVAVVDEEDRLLDEVEMTTLMPEQVNIFRENFPSIYAALTETVDDAIVEVNTKKIELVEEVETVLQTLLGTGQAQGPNVEPEEKEPARKGNTKLKAEAQQTLTERLAAR